MYNIHVSYVFASFYIWTQFVQTYIKWLLLGQRAFLSVFLNATRQSVIIILTSMFYYLFLMRESKHLIVTVLGSSTAQPCWDVFVHCTRGTPHLQKLSKLWMQA